MGYKGLFAGLTTIDIQYIVERFPVSNTKVKASAPELLVGGPATNAAIAFACLNGNASLASATGKTAFSSFIQNDFMHHNIVHVNLNPSVQSLPVLATVVTTECNGDRTIFSHAPGKIEPELSATQLFTQVQPHIVLLDGFHPEISVGLARVARNLNVPVVLDCGSWKPQYTHLFQLADIAICSETFFPPNCQNIQEVADFLHRDGIPKIAVTRGSENVFFSADGKTGEVPVEKLNIIDSLGAGDIFHGAFCYYYLHLNRNFEKALEDAAKLATFTCKFKGTRSWINKFRQSC